MQLSLSILRQVYREARRKYKFIVRKPVFQTGAPYDLSLDDVAAVCRDHFMDSMRSVSYQHLSGWKNNGAFRLRISTVTGRVISLIYKNSIYTADETPGITGFPVRPGKSEYLILSQSSAQPLQDFLPKTYLSKEIVADSHYQYIMEDLDENYYISRGPAAIKRASGLLSQAHRALEEWSGTAIQAGMIDYRFLVSPDFYGYAYDTLARLDERHNGYQVLKDVLKSWSALVDLHSELRRSAMLLTQAPQLIHGDANFSNVHLHKRIPSRLVLVDWEWAGFGDPVLDLASLLKGVDTTTELQSRKRFFASLASSPLPQEDHCARSYSLNQLERGILDASYLSAHLLTSSHKAKFDVLRAIMNSLGRVLASYRQLS